jgi:esterase/lipase superfamily enzyme
LFTLENKSTMNTNKLIHSILLTVLILISAEVLSKGFTNPYEFTLDYQITNTLPEDASQYVLIISNREFLPDENFAYERNVSKNRARFFFIASQVNNSTYLTSYNSIDSALSVFSDNKSFLVFVNGHGKNFEQTIVRGFDLGERYNVNMIMFDWPTEYYALRKTARNAREVTENFALSVKELNDAFDEREMNSNISVIFHSMGNLIARNIVKKGFVEELPENVFQNLILNAAAVKQRNHREWVDQLHIQNRIYIVSNREDLPLKGVKLLRLTVPLGSEYKGQLSENAQYIDFSEIAGREHNLFLGKTQAEKNHPNIYSFYLSLFRGDEIDLSNPEEFADNNRGQGFIIL